jgi:Glutaredoxin-related protein
MNTFLQRCMLPRLAINSRFHNAWRTPYSTDVQKSIDEMVKKSKVVVFMKGVPEAPRCGFSNAVVQILRMHDVPYDR